MSRAVRRHYASSGLITAIDAALARSGHDPGAPTADALEGVDEFHLRGSAATRALAEAAGLRTGMRVLDLGSGLGGPSRRLAAEVGCRVIGLDLNPDYVAVARILADRTGLDDRASYAVADAVLLPLPGQSVDAVWMQHVGMNVPDKRALYAEVSRVLRPGGVLALYDVLAGPGGPPHLPAPWASDPAISHLVDAPTLQGLLAQAGLSIEEIRDRRVDALAWMEDAGRRRREAGPPAVGLDLLFGDAFAEMGRNLKRNLVEERIVPTEIVARRN